MLPEAYATSTSRFPRDLQPQLRAGRLQRASLLLRCSLGTQPEGATYLDQTDRGTSLPHIICMYGAPP